MPSNFLTEHRQRFSEFKTQSHRDQYLYHSGQKHRLETRHLESEFSDLFSAATIVELHKELDSSNRENDRAGIKLLIANATTLHLHSRVRELSDEIRDYESQASIVWEGETISFADSTKLLRDEASSNKRHDIAKRRAEIIKGGQDLRAERLDKLHESAQELGAESYLKLYENLREIDYENLSNQLQSFLSQTERAYVAALSPALLRESNVALNEATNADLPHFRRLARFTKFFPAWQLKHAYRETYSGLGIFTYKQDNVIVDETSRSNQAHHFPIRVPDEIRVIFSAQDGAPNFRAMLHETGHAQQFAWTSRNLFPEFQFTGDGAVREVFGLLFAGLLSEHRWLIDLLSYHESDEFRHLLSVQKLMTLRRFAAKLEYEIELHTGKLSSHAGTSYTELLTEAVRVRHDDSEHLRDVEDGFAVTDYLRAAAFEAQLREQLKTKFGTRWWTSRKAGDYLIDLWNTGGRYKAEEMAKMIDLGELSFDWSAEDCLSNLS